MRFLLTAIFALTLSSLIAQVPGRPTGGQQITGRFYGKLVEAGSGKGIEYASVQLTQSKMDTVTKSRQDVVVAGMLTKSNGEFSLDNVPVFGQFKLKVTAIGYKTYEKPVAFDLKRPANGAVDMSAMLNMTDKDLGNIKIEMEEKTLDNVTVTATRPGLSLGIDRKVFNVDKNIVSAGGTAVDIMRNVPSLNVDIDGNVTMRNSSPQIFVDGRPSNLTLEQIPADAIQSVELITNPSAKFDASGGTAGILNIVLKKEKKVGYNGNVRANVDSRGKVGAGGDINLRQQKVNIFASGMYNQRKSIGTGTTDRVNLFDTPDTYIHQYDKNTTNGAFGFGRAGLDYFITNRSTISLSANFAKGSFKPFNYSTIMVDTLNQNAGRSSYYERNTNSEGNFRNLGTTLSFKHNFPKAGREFTADVTYNKSRNLNNSNIVTDTFAVPSFTKRGTYSQRQDAEGENENIIIQSDFVNPINEKTKVEMGVRAQIRSNSNNSAFYLAKGGAYLLQPSSVTDYQSDDQVYAAYVTYSSQLKNFGYQLGLRAESSNYDGTLKTTNEDFNIKFPVSLFPSVFLSQKISEDQSLQLNYSRRINRPNFWQLTPITDSSDKLNPSKGNPALQPEFTNSLELSYEKSFKSKGNFLASLYYKNTNDLITRFQQIGTGSGGETIALNTYINANSSFVAGLELTSRNNITKWWEFTPNINVYTSDVKINIAGETDQPRLTSFFAKLNNNFKFPYNISLQVSGDYQSKTILPPGGSSSRMQGGFGGMFGGGASASQGYVRPTYGMDLAVRYEFLKNRTAAVSLNMNDVFRTRRTDIHSESSFIIQDAFRRRDAQVLRLNLSYRFGKFDPNLFKRKNTKSQNEGGGMEGMQGGQ